MGMIQDFQKADEERRREVKQLQHEVSTFVKDLVKGSAERASGVATMLRDLRGQAPGRRAEVAAIAQEATAIVEATDTFVKDLVKGSTERRSEVATMLKDFAGEGNERRSAVNGIRSDVATMLKDFAGEGNGRRSTVASRHQMVWGKAPARRKVAPVIKDLPREAAIETTPAGELRDKVFAYLTNHPDGTRLTELEEAFGVARIQTARVIRELMDNNKVTKRELLYFAI